MFVSGSKRKRGKKREAAVRALVFYEDFFLRGGAGFKVHFVTQLNHQKSVIKNKMKNQLSRKTF